MNWRVGTAWLLALIWVVASCRSAQADTLDDVRARGVLRWGADAEGGGPFVFFPEDQPTELQGFEVELAAVLARHLGVKAEFHQGQWDKLPDLLSRGDVDLVLNGYEWTPAWADRFGTTVPYYLYELQFLARRDDPSLQALEDLPRAPAGRKWRVAVLGGSAAETYLATEYREQVEIIRFDGNTDAMRAVELGLDGLDATLQDLPIVTFYESGFPALRRVGRPVGFGYYVVLVRRDDQRLLAALNDALLRGLQDGSLRRIYERYGMWNAAQQRRALEQDASGSFRGDLRGDDEPGATASYLASRGWDVITSRGPLLLRAALVTVALSVIAMPLAMGAGLSVALGRLYGPALLRVPLGWYVELLRGTPLVLQLYVIYFLLPEVGINIPAFWAAILGLAVNYSSYEAEIYRAGLLAIPVGQMEAAMSLGMSRRLALRRVVVPQACRLVVPAVTNDFIALFKDTAVCSVITVVELSKEYYIHARSTGAIVELGLLTAVLYLAMSFPLSLLTRRLEVPRKRDLAT